MKWRDLMKIKKNKFEVEQGSKSGGFNNTALLQLLGRTSAGRAGCGTDLAECVLATG